MLCSYRWKYRYRSPVLTSPKHVSLITNISLWYYRFPDNDFADGDNADKLGGCRQVTKNKPGYQNLQGHVQEEILSMHAETRLWRTCGKTQQTV